MAWIAQNYRQCGNSVGGHHPFNGDIGVAQAVERHRFCVYEGSRCLCVVITVREPDQEIASRFGSFTEPGGCTSEGGRVVGPTTVVPSRSWVSP